MSAPIAPSLPDKLRVELNRAVAVCGSGAVR